ncbi:MAG: Rieske 2Fe-2S domain-containing protein [Microthrixaceae bacterium]|nr:Rieske 2Fe-2S domain-containing protein [Microthrixaceae bacterium]
MSVLLIVIPLLVVLAGVLLFAAFRRRETGEAVGLLSRETRRKDADASPAPSSSDAAPTGREVERAAAAGRAGTAVAVVDETEAAPPAPFVPPDPEALGVTRRQFLNRSIVAFFGLGLAAFGASALAFIWPKLGGGFGSKITVGNVSDLLAEIRANNGFLYKAEGRMWLTEYPSSALSKAQSVYAPPVLASMEEGITVVYQKCPHLGCRVPECETSQWFECPCHGSQYNQAGEKKAGPAPRGMDRFATAVSGGRLTVDTGLVIQGPPIGTNTTGQEAEGPHCIGG